MPFTPHATMKDAVSVVIFLIIFAWFVFYIPNYLNHADNFNKANPLQTPAHIVPEWYLLPFYAILRAIPNKLLGVILMFGSIGVLFLLPWLDTSRTFSELSAALPTVLLDLRGRGDRARLSRLAAARGRIRHRGADPDILLLPLPDPAAAARSVRTPKPRPASIAESVLGSGEASQRVPREAPRRQRHAARGAATTMQIAITGSPALLLTLPLCALNLAAAQENAGEEHAQETPHYPLLHPRHAPWSFAGPFGKYAIRSSCSAGSRSTTTSVRTVIR